MGFQLPSPAREYLGPCPADMTEDDRVEVKLFETFEAATYRFDLSRTNITPMGASTNPKRASSRHYHAHRQRTLNECFVMPDETIDA
jgi:hypothetical protein